MTAQVPLAVKMRNPGKLLFVAFVTILSALLVEDHILKILLAGLAVGQLAWLARLAYADRRERGGTDRSRGRR